MNCSLAIALRSASVGLLSLGLLAGCTKQPDPTPDPEETPKTSQQTAKTKDTGKIRTNTQAQETPVQPVVEKPILVSAVDLVKAFNTDRAAATERYKGKTIYVEGVIAQVESPEEGIGGTITLEGISTEDIEPGKIKEVLLNLRYGTRDTSRVREDMPVKVTGVCTGIGFQQVVELASATIVEIKRIPPDVIKKKEETEKSLALLKSIGVGYAEYPGNVWEIHLRPEHLVPNGQIKPEVIAALLKIQRLRGVSVELMPLNDAGLEGLKPFTRLEKLSLEGTRVTDAGIVHLKTLTRLHSLDLSGTSVTNAALGQLQGMRYLDALGLASTQINDEGLAQLKLFPKLHTLHLADTTVSDAGVEHLVGLAALSELGLAKTKISDVGLKHLSGLRNLKLLTVSRKSVTMMGIEQLKESLPGLELKTID